MTTTNQQISVRFARRSTRGLLLGFSTPRVIAVGGAISIAIGALFFIGPSAFVVSGVLWGPLLASAFIVIAGKPSIEWAGIACHFGSRKATKQSEFRVRIPSVRASGTLALPGDGASMRVHIDEASGAAMIHDPHRNTLSAVLSVSHPAFVLLDESDRNQRVSQWGRVLAQLAQSGTCAAIQVLEATIPDPARGQREWWEANGVHDGKWAATQYNTLLDQVCLDSSTHRSTITLALDMKKASRAIRAAGRGIKGAGEVLRGDMATLTDSLRQAGLKPGKWLSEEELATIIRHVFDPTVSLDSRTSPGANLTNAGPVAVSESWDHLRHDSAFSAVLWISEWPRISVPADFLHPLIFAPGVRRTLSIISKPLPTEIALRQIRKEKTEAVTDSAQKARIGQLADLSDAQEYDDLISREKSVIAGHTDVEFSGLVTVTAPSKLELDSAVSSITRATGQALCDVRPLYGRQMQGFLVGALPLARGVFS